MRLRSNKETGEPGVKLPMQAADRVTKKRGVPNNKQNARMRNRTTMGQALSNQKLALDSIPQQNTEMLNSSVGALGGAEDQVAPDPLASGTPSAITVEPVSVRDRVLQTTELLENILSFAGYRTLLTSVLRVNKHWNAVVTASPRLRKAMFESFSNLSPSCSILHDDYVLNDALCDLTLLSRPRPIPIPRLQVHAECNCDECVKPGQEPILHYIASLPASYQVAEGQAVVSNIVPSWAKLRVLSPTDTDSAQAEIKPYYLYVVRFYCSERSMVLVREVSFNKTLGQLISLLDCFTET